MSSLHVLGIGIGFVRFEYSLRVNVSVCSFSLYVMLIVEVLSFFMCNIRSVCSGSTKIKMPT